MGWGYIKNIIFISSIKKVVKKKIIRNPFTNPWKHKGLWEQTKRSIRRLHTQIRKEKKVAEKELLKDIDNFKHNSREFFKHINQSKMD